MRRLFIIRKDLHLKPGKLAAMVSHCAEAYWLNLMKNNFHERNEAAKVESCHFDVDADIWDNYITDIFTKTVCEAKNLNKVKEVGKQAEEELGLKEGADFGYINDSCKTDLTPENPDGTCTVGIWFKPFPDEIAHSISKKFKLYRDD